MNRDLKTEPRWLARPLAAVFRVGLPFVKLGVVVAVLLALLFVLTSSPRPARSDEARHRVVASNPDPRVTWRQYPVGGLLLCLPNKEIADTLGVPQCQEIPPGAVLLIPVVADPVKSPDRRKS